MVSSTPRPHFTSGKDTVPILQEAGWVPGPVWTDGKSRHHRDSIPDRPARSHSLYRLSYRAHTHIRSFSKTLCPEVQTRLSCFRLRLKCDFTLAETRIFFRRNGRVHLNRQGRQFSRLLAAEVSASALVMLDTPCSEAV